MRRAVFAVVLMLTVLSLQSIVAQAQGGTTVQNIDPAELQARRQAALEMVHEMQPREKFEERISVAIGPALAQLTRRSKRGENLTPDYSQRMQRAIAEAMPYDEMVLLTAEAYAKRLTLDELGQVTSFYESPAGQKLTLIEPQVTAEMLQSIMTTMLSRIEKAMKKERLMQPERNTPPKQ